MAASVVVVMLESVAEVKAQYGQPLLALEWIFTGIFTVEYALRLYCVDKPLRYATSFFGVVDLLAVLPSYLSPLLPGAQSLLVIRVLRMLRVFRVLKLAEYLSESSELWDALRRSRRKIFVFLFTVTTIVVDRRRGDVPGRGPRARLHQYPDQRLLGGRHADDGRLRRHLPPDSARPLPRNHRDADGLWDHRRANRHRHRRDVAPDIRTRHDPSLPGCGAEGHDHDALFCRKCGASL